MEESFPRGGKRQVSAKSDDGASSAKKKRYSSSDRKSDKTSAVKSNSSKRESSLDPLGAMWTKKLTPEVCIPDLSVLGCVRTILDDCVLLELPDGLRAVLSLMDISSILTNHLLQQQKDQSNSSGDLSNVTVKLKEYFTLGQLIGCRIMRSDDKSKKKKKRQLRFSVTIDPARVNSVLSFSDVTDGMVLNGAVRSIEEKGYLIDLGLGASAPGSFGFLPFDQCPQIYQAADESKRLRVGQVLLCAVMDAPSKETAAEKRVIRLSCLPTHLNGSSDFSDKHQRKEQYLPGLVVKAVVDKVVASKGLIVRLAKPGGGCWRGFVSKYRLQTRGSKPMDYKPQQSLKVTILYTITNSTVFGLSAESHLTARAADATARTDLLDIAHIGDLIDGRVTIATAKGPVFFELLFPKHKTPIFAKIGRSQLETNENDDEDNTELRYSVGSKHRLRITGFSLIDRIFIGDARKKIFKQPIVNVESCVPGTLVQAVVWKTISDSGVFVRLYDCINGYIPFLHCHDGLPARGAKKKLDKKYGSGKVVKARILYADMEKNRVVLTTKKQLVSSDISTCVNSFDSAFTGELADGFVVQINAEKGLLVAFFGKARGWLPKSELEKFGIAVNQKLTDVFHLGEVVRVRIHRVDPVNEKMVLSPAGGAEASGNSSEKENATTASAKEIKKEPAVFAKKGGSLAIGKIYTAIITKIQKLQLDVLIENQYHGRVFATELSDSLAHGSIPVANFCVGQAILVKIIGIRSKRHRTKNRRDSKGSESEILGANELDGKKTFHFADCTMRKSKIMAKSAKKRAIGYKDEFRKGEQVSVVIEEVTIKDGVVQGCRVAANPIWKGDIPILHLSMDIDQLHQLRDRFLPGQVVNARVTGTQTAEKHLQLSCLPAKSSNLAFGEETKALVIRDDSDEFGVKCRLIDGSSGYLAKRELTGDLAKIFGQIVEVRPVEKLSGGKWRLSVKGSSVLGKKIKEELTFEAIVSKKPSTDKEVYDVKPILSKDTTTAAAQKMRQAARFSWDSGRFSMANLMNLCLDENGSGEVKGDGQPPASDKSKKGVKSKFERERQEEEELLQKEMDLLNPDRPLESTDDFDRLVMGSPDSSLIWIRYMAFFLQRGDVAKAKAVAERALKTISVGEDKERFNVWTALLNLENACGTSESFRQTFDEALAVNDPLKIYQLGTKVLRRSNKIEECDKLYDEVLSKFKSEFDVWVSMGDYYMSTTRADKAQDLMRRAMKSLPQTRHIDLISRFAQMEYRYSKNTDKSTAVGDPERGRTLFENILRDCPKRTDVWSVYIDMTSKFQSIDEARPIFERVTSMKLNVHNMRLFYKKWLELEERLGTPETLSQVKKRAAEYVQGSLDRLSFASAEDTNDDNFNSMGGL